MAILVGTALLAAEAYQLLMTVERTIAMRDARQAPIIAQATAREKASQRVVEAAGLAALPIRCGLRQPCGRSRRPTALLWRKPRNVAAPRIAAPCSNSR